MEAKKRKDAGEESASLNYDDILNGFAFEGNPEQNTGMPLGDLDGLAIAELLGDEPPAPKAAPPAGNHDAVTETGEYAELARQFESLDMSEFAGEGEDAGETVAEDAAEPVPDSAEPIVEDEDYTLLIDHIGNENASCGASSDSAEAQNAESHEEEFAGEPVADGLPDLMTLPDLDDDDVETPHEPEEKPILRAALGVINLADDSLLEEPLEGEAQARPVEKSGELSLNDLFAKETDSMENPAGGIIPPAQEAEPAMPGPIAKPEGNFLELVGMPGAGGLPKRPSGRMETLFEGVEMDFDEQVAHVTLAELLLAQGKRKEATDIFQEVSRRKGVTSWVSNRLRSLTASVEK